MNLRFVLFASAILLGSVSTVPAAEHPNVVWLVSEDNSVHYLDLYDEHGTSTPRIDELADHGLVYDHAFSNAPVCSVARTTLITGCYAPRIGTQYHRRSVTVPMPAGLRMFPWYLRKAGYYTANNRKKDYNAIEGAGVWDESSPKATWKNRKDGQPFFYFQSFTTTHESSLHPMKFPANEVTKTDPETVFVAPYHPNTPTFRKTNAAYRDRMQRVDAEIGGVVDQLRQDEVLDDTFIFYFGDHGGVLPRGKGYAYESGLHVPLVVYVPDNWKHLVDAEAGSRVGGFVEFIDFGPTVLKLAGIETPEPMDGEAFLGQGVRMADVNRRNEAFGYADRFDEKWDLVRTLRVGKYEYVRNYQPFNFDGLQNNYRYIMVAYQEWRNLYEAGKLNAAQAQFFETRPTEMLFDLEADPHEVNNLAGDPQHSGTLITMRTRLKEFMSDLPDLSMYPENELVDSAFDSPVEFGQSHKQKISRLIDIADLNLVSFNDAKAGGLATALSSSDPWSRYWALIVCSSHGKAAEEFVPTAKRIAAKDPEPMVRVRAAEFLGLIGAADPRPVIMDVLSKSTNGVEAGLALNTVVLLQDGKPGYKFSVTESSLTPAARKNDQVKRRLLYLAP